MFISLVTYVVFCGYRCWFDVLSVACNNSSCVGDLYLVLPVMIVIALAYYCTIGPWSPIFPLNCYSCPVGIDIKIFEVSLSQSFLSNLCITFLWCSSSLSILIGFLYITDIMPHTGQLNSNVAGLGRPWPSGVVLICSNTMCISPPESEHFFIVWLMNLMQASTCLLLWW